MHVFFISVSPFPHPIPYRGPSENYRRGFTLFSQKSPVSPYSGISLWYPDQPDGGRTVKKLYHHLKNNLHYTDYQIRVLHYFFLTTGSEISKLALIGCYFYLWGKLDIYFFSIILLWFLRFCSGGLHQKTYLRCLAVSFSYLVLCIQILPVIPLPKPAVLLLLTAAAIAGYRIGPIPSPFRKHITAAQKAKYRRIQLWGFFFYLAILFITPLNTCLLTGFWVIMIHILQLYVAHRRGGETHDQIHRQQAR